MLPSLLKTSVILVLAIVGIPFALACYCLVRFGPSTASLADLRPAGLSAIPDYSESHCKRGVCVAVEFRYRIGMSRDEIRRNFAPGARMIASDSRPDKNWRPVRNVPSGLADYVFEFERIAHNGLVTTCDVYDDGSLHYVLFFDEAEVLIGALQFPSFICASACLEGAKEATSALIAGHCLGVAPSYGS